jgi:predicted nucleic acid-binding protein
MKYLLDVNALIALGLFEHEFHGRVARWVHRLAAKGTPALATCAITELGFVRVLAQAPQYGFTVGQACQLLGRLKAAQRVSFTFIPDGLDISHLPRWVKTAKQTTDGHLARLALAHKAVLATLDRGIPQAFLIPMER